MPVLTIGVLALQGAFAEHIKLLHLAADSIINNDSAPADLQFSLLQVRTPSELAECDALIIPGGESTSIALIASRNGLLQPLREFVKVDRKPVWGTCAGLILLAESADRTKRGGQELLGGLDVRVRRNYFGRQVESFEGEVRLGFLGGEGFEGVFIRAPVVERILREGEVGVENGEGEVVVAPDVGKGNPGPVEVLGRLPPRANGLKANGATKDDEEEGGGDIVVVRQGNVFGTAFHPELTGDPRIHVWWLREVVKAVDGVQR